MRKYMLVGFMILFSTAVFAQKTNWNFDKAHSSIGFTIDHMVISEVAGQFTKFDGSFTSDKEDFSDAKITFTIETNSINTENKKRDAHLKNKDFFDATKYPVIEFKSTSFKKVKENKYKLSGSFTMHGVTKPIELDVKYGGSIKDPWGNTRIGFKLNGTLDRTDYGLTWNNVLETGGLMVGKEVRIEGRFELVQEK